MKTLIKLVTLQDGGNSVVLVVYPKGNATIQAGEDATTFASEAEAMDALGAAQEVEEWAYVEDCGSQFAAYTIDGDEGLGVFDTRQEAVDAVVGELEAF